MGHGPGYSLCGVVVSSDHHVQRAADVKVSLFLRSGFGLCVCEDFHSASQIERKAHFTRNDFFFFAAHTNV